MGLLSRLLGREASHEEAPPQPQLELPRELVRIHYTSWWSSAVATEDDAQQGLVRLFTKTIMDGLPFADTNRIQEGVPSGMAFTFDSLEHNGGPESVLYIDFLQTSLDLAPGWSGVPEGEFQRTKVGQMTLPAATSFAVEIRGPIEVGKTYRVRLHGYTTYRIEV